MMMVIHLVEAAVRKIRSGSRGSRWRLVALGNVERKLRMSDGRIVRMIPVSCNCSKAVMRCRGAGSLDWGNY